MKKTKILTYITASLLFFNISSCKDEKSERNGSSQKNPTANSSNPQDETVDSSNQNASNIAIRDNYDRAVKAMVEVTSAHFQSCAPLLKVDGEPTKTIKDEFNTSLAHNNPAICIDRRNANLDYLGFSKGSFNPNAGKLQIVDGKVNALARFHCSGFLAATMAAAGQKYHVSQNSVGYSPFTAELTKVFDRDDSCFKSPKISSTISIKPGDILNTSHGHTIRILSVGDDPLGLKDINKESECQRIDHKNFNFTFVHSTSRYKDNGLSGVRVESASKTETSIVRKFAKILKSLCEETVTDTGISGVLKDTKVGTKESILGFTNDVIFSLRRHIGDEQPACLIQPVMIEGGRCVSASCLGEVL